MCSLNFFHVHTLCVCAPHSTDVQRYSVYNEAKNIKNMYSLSVEFNARFTQTHSFKPSPAHWPFNMLCSLFRYVTGVRLMNFGYKNIRDKNPIQYSYDLTELCYTFRFDYRTSNIFKFPLMNIELKRSSWLNEV